MPDPWRPVSDALARADHARRNVHVWLRDDDAVTVTPALDRLTAIVRRHAVPLLLATIPRGADRLLGAHVAAEPLITPTQHGFAHLNHAGPGERACEVGGSRPLADTLDDLRHGRDLMHGVFGNRAADVLVPPWNRIAPEVLPHLPALGFGRLSTFAEAHAGVESPTVVNSSLDIIDWRGGRRTHPESKLITRLAALIDDGGPIGLLTHHLVHDEEAWRFLDDAFARLRAAPAVRLVSIDDVSRPSRSVDRAASARTG